MTDISDCSVMVVDDVEANIDILVNTLGDSYDVAVALDGKSALESIAENKPDLILLDIMMPGMDGYEVCRRLKADDETKNIPILFLTAMTEEQDEERGLKLGAVDYITKPFSVGLVKARVHNQLELKLHRDHLEELVRERTRQLELTQEVTIESMGALAEYRDPETGGHIRRTQSYLELLANHLKDHPKFKEFLNDPTIELILKSAPLHDIGKIGVSDLILLKPGQLNSQEFEDMKKHSLYGRDAIAFAEKKLGKDSFLKYAKIIAESHHEKWDGTGYPHGRKGEGIPVVGRLMAVADVYDALISKRVYKPPYPHNRSVEVIKTGRGTHFDPDIVDAFLELEEEFRKVALKFADFEEERENLMS